MSVFLPDRNASNSVIFNNQHDGEKSKDHPNKALSLKRGGFASPLQEKTFTLVINSLIEAKKLSYQLFRDYLPQIAELAHPENKIRVIFESFRLISKHFNEEFAPRAFWARFDEYRYLNSYQLIGKVNKSQCGTTYQVLIASIFGKALTPCDLFAHIKLPFSTTQTNPVEAIQSIATSNLLKPKKPDSFYAYSFGLSNKAPFPGHCFVVLQYSDKYGDSRYHLFQSYINHYTLSDYLKSGPHTLSHFQFLDFLTNLKLCMTSPVWTKLEDDFFKQYFGDPMIGIGNLNHCSKTTVTFTYGERNLQDFVALHEEFQDSKVFFRHPEFKKTHSITPESIVFCKRKHYLAKPFPFHLNAPRILTIEGNRSQVGIKMQPTNKALKEQIQMGVRLLESFSDSELSDFYDSYGNLVYDWLDICSKVTRSSFFFTELKKAFSNLDSTVDIKEESEIIAELFCKTLFNDGQRYFYCDQQSLSTFIETIAREHGERGVQESSDMEFMHRTCPSKKEVLGLWFYQMLLRFLDPDEIIEKKKIRLGAEILFPLPQEQGISALEKMAFTLIPLLLSALTTKDPFASSVSYSNYAPNDELFINIVDGLNSYALKACRENILNGTDQLENKTVLLFEKAHKVTQIYPYLKSKFLHFILAPISMLSTFDSSPILSLEQKSELNRYSHAVLDLYFHYFDKISGEKLRRRASKKEKNINPARASSYSTGQNALKFLEMIHDAPDLFSKYVEFQLQCMQDLLNPFRRDEDLKRGRHGFLPHVGINTPFIEAMTHRSYLKVALEHTRNYREFLLISQYFNTQNFTKLRKKYSNNEIIKLIEKLIQEIIHEKIHPSLLDELHEGTRFITNRATLRNFIKATGIPAIMDDFLLQESSQSR